MFRKHGVSGSCLWRQKDQPGYGGAGRRITAQKPTNRKTTGASDAPPGTRCLLLRRPSLITEHGPHVDAGISVSFIRAENCSQEVRSVFQNISLGSAAKAAIPVRACSRVACGRWREGAGVCRCGARVRGLRGGEHAGLQGHRVAWRLAPSAEHPRAGKFHRGLTGGGRCSGNPAALLRCCVQAPSSSEWCLGV